MPTVIEINGYKLYFWSNEMNEPIHLHVTMNKPAGNSTKIWITRNKKPLLCHNKSRIPNNVLSDIFLVVTNNADLIIDSWREFFGAEPTYFC